MNRPPSPLSIAASSYTLLGSVAAWPLAARAQQGKVLHLGIVTLTPRAAPNWVAFEARLKEFGFVDGQNLDSPHSSLDGSTPDQAYFNQLPLRLAA